MHCLRQPGDEDAAAHAVRIGPVPRKNEAKAVANQVRSLNHGDRTLRLVVSQPWLGVVACLIHSAEDLDLLRQNSPPRERLLEDKLKQKQRPATAHPTRGRHTKILTRIDSVITTHVTEQPKQQPEDEPEDHAQTLQQDAQESTELKPIIPIPEAERPTTAPVVHFDARKHVFT